MPAKKPAKKVPAKSSVGFKAKSFAKDFEKEAKVFKSESKEIGTKI